MKMIAVAAVALTAAALTAAERVEKFEIDAAQTSIGFTVRHLGVSNVSGKFNQLDGEIYFDEANITRSSVRITVDAASIDTENEKRDNHLRSADFFEVERFPHLTFVSRRVEKKGSRLQVVGDLTIRDVTREVAIPFTLRSPAAAGTRKRLGAEGSLVINRFDYGLKWNRMTEAVAVVGPEVRIDLVVEARTPAGHH
jgi:polyisoprenoid-binding protein YceI